MKINRTTQRTIEILELIANSPIDLTLNDISKTLEMPKTSAYDILETLVHANMLYIKDPRFKTYAIGVKAYVIGNNYSKTSLLLNSSKPYLEQLTRATNKVAVVAKENNNKVIITSKVNPEKRIIAGCEVGDFYDMYCTSLGKAILAFSPNRTKILENLELVPKTSYTVKNMDELTMQLEQIRKNGYAVEIQETEEYLYGISAPIYDYFGVVAASVGVFGLYNGHENMEEEVELVIQTAQNISKLLGYEKTN